MTRLRTAARATWHRLHLSVPGCWVGLLLAVLSFLPSLIPRPALFQGLMTGISAAIGYGIGTLLAWVVREIADRPARPAGAHHVRVLTIVALVSLAVAVVLGVSWQRAGSTLLALDPEPWPLALMVLPVAGLVFLVVLAVMRLLRRATRVVIRTMSRTMGPRAARVIGVATVLVLVAMLFNGVILDRTASAVNAAFALADTGTPDGLRAPTSPLRSGSPDSLIAWESLGREGRTFVAQGPNATDIAATRAPGLDVDTHDPIRVYAGLDSAPDVEARAILAVRDLERAGGFARDELLIVTTTGTGWVEPTSVGAFEHLALGDSATISMQYSFLPSPLSFLADRENARDAGRALFDAVYERWIQLPADARPRLYVFGESLGSFGGEAAFSGEHDMANRLSGAVFTGPPSFNQHFGQFLRDREAGTSAVSPVYRDGRTVRFTANAREPVEPVDQPWDGTRILYMVHPSDAITWWNSDLILQRPDWLTEPRGDGVMEQTRWVPFVSFWHLTGDMGLAMEPGPGYGHNFAGEHVDAWAQVLRVEGWDTARSETIRRAVMVEAPDPFIPTS